MFLNRILFTSLNFFKKICNRYCPILIKLAGSFGLFQKGFVGSAGSSFFSAGSYGSLVGSYVSSASRCIQSALSFGGSAESPASPMVSFVLSSHISVNLRNSFGQSVKTELTSFFLSPELNSQYS